MTNSKWTRYVLVSALIASSILNLSCSTAKVSSSTGINDTAAVSSADREYQELKNSVTEYHSRAVIGPDQPWVFQPSKGTDDYFREFASSYCPKNLSITGCEERFRNAVGYLLSQVYFAADLFEVQKKCAADVLVCGDLQTLEVLFRDLHNQSVEESKREKLAKIDEWHSGKLSDSDLETALHIHFKVQDGHLVISLPEGGAMLSRTD